MLQNILPTIDYPSAFSNWLMLHLDFDEQNKELAIFGNESFDYAKRLNTKYLPNIILAVAKNESKLPFLKDKQETKSTKFYLCQNKSCSAPTENF
jgi:uncharacterized protein YyaL (SSP411 family)